MKTVSIIILLLALASPIRPAAAQTRFLPGGHSGLWGGLVGQYRPYDIRRGLEMTYSHRGRFDFGLGVDTDSYKSKRADKWGLARYAILAPSGPSGPVCEAEVLVQWESYSRNYTYIDYNTGAPTQYAIASRRRFTDLALRGGYRVTATPGLGMIFSLRAFVRSRSFDGTYSSEAYHGLDATIEVLLLDLLYAAGEVRAAGSGSQHADWGLRLGIVVDFEGGDRP